MLLELRDVVNYGVLVVMGLYLQVSHGGMISLSVVSAEGLLVRDVGLGS